MFMLRAQVCVIDCVRGCVRVRAHDPCAAAMLLAGS